MRVLIGCESSAVIRDAFRARGHDAYSCDLLECEGDPQWHYRCDVRNLLTANSWDLFIVHPDCTFLCRSGLHWNKRVPGREEKTKESLDFVRYLLNAPVPMMALENPPGRIGSQIRPADQYIQPYDFGHDAGKMTGLWLKGLPPLKPTKHVPGRLVEWPRGSGKMVRRWANQTDSGQNNLAPSKDRWRDRSRTYAGWAEAMADQWGPLELTL